MKKIFIIVLSLLPAGLYAQSAINADVMKELKAGFKNTAADKAVRNALNNKGVNDLAQTNAVPFYDSTFTYRVKTSGVTNQHSSGRCWAFCSMNMLRAGIKAERNLGDFMFSQSYIYFYDVLEKANQKLTFQIELCDSKDDSPEFVWVANGYGDGGSFIQFANLAKKYGLVPKAVMPETFTSNHTAKMRQLINLKLKEDFMVFRHTYESAVKGLSGKKKEAAAAKAREKMQVMKVDMLKDIYRILCLCIGTPPQEFTYYTYDSKGKVTGEKVYTPKSFYDEYVGKDLTEEYVYVGNNPAREYGKVYVTERGIGVYGGKDIYMINIPIEKMKEIAIASLRGGSPMYLGCDVGKFKTQGWSDPSNYDYDSLLGVHFGMDKGDRVRTGDSGSTHAMNLIAVQLKEGKPARWMVENSWGNKGYNGNVILSDDWFNEYAFSLCVKKEYVPADVMGLLGNEPVKRKPWDPTDIHE